MLNYYHLLKRLSGTFRRVCLRLSQFTQLSFMPHMGLFLFMMIARIRHQSEVWTICYCFGFGHETMGCAVYLEFMKSQRGQNPIIMELHNSFMELHNSYMELHNSFMEPHNSIMEVHDSTYLWRFIIDSWNSIIDLWSFIIRFMDLHDSIYGSP